MEGMESRKFRVFVFFRDSVIQTFPRPSDQRPSDQRPPDELVHTILNASTSVHLRTREKSLALVTPSPVGLAMEKEL